MVCYCCGKVGHAKPTCKYITYSCKICYKVGHLQKVCKNKDKFVNNIEQNDVDLNLNNLFSLESVNVNYVRPYCIKLYVNSIEIEFQVDTGAGVSVISKKELEYYKFSDVKELCKTDVTLKTYNGSVIIPLGILKVKVKYKDCVEFMKLYVVNNGGPPIVGRDWLTIS